MCMCVCGRVGGREGGVVCVCVCVCVCEKVVGCERGQCVCVCESVCVFLRSILTCQTEHTASTYC